MDRINLMPLMPQQTVHEVQQQLAKALSTATRCLWASQPNGELLEVGRVGTPVRVVLFLAFPQDELRVIIHLPTAEGLVLPLQLHLSGVGHVLPIPQYDRDYWYIAMLIKSRIKQHQDALCRYGGLAGYTEYLSGTAKVHREESHE